MSNNLAIAQEENDFRRFLSHAKISDNSDCWNYSGHKRPNGYAAIKLKGRITMVLAHRFSFQNFVMDIPENLLVLHKCDNRSCVNPSHLFLGTQKDNMDDMHNKGRFRHWNTRKPVCKNGHQFTIENTRLRCNGQKRTCIECSRAAWRRHDQTRRNRS